MYVDFNSQILGNCILASVLNAWMLISMVRENPDTHNESLHILNQLPTSQSWPIGRVWHYYTICLGTVPAAAQTFSRKKLSRL